MNDEAPPLPKQPEQEHSPLLHPGNVHPFSKSETRFVRFVQKIGQIFARRPSQDSSLNLSGRVLELQTMADQMFAELVAFKKEVREKVDVELFSLVVVFVDPLMKETGKAPPVMNKDENTVHQVKLFSRYVESIEKANAWVKIGKECGTQKELERAIIQHAAEEFLLRIDRDIQIIQDYLNCALEDIKRTEIINNQLVRHLMPILTLKITELDQLKTLPEDFSLQSFIRWRIYADERREQYFSDALHLIDGFAEEFDSGQRRKNLNSQSEEIAETNF